jgi:hypothetical protein
MIALLDQTQTQEDLEREAGLETFEVPQAVIDELIKGRHMQRVQAVKEQRMAAAALGTRHHLPYGEVTMQVHPTIFHYWGQRLGYECWDDEQFCKEMCRDNPELRVKSVSPNPTVSFAPSKKKFSKTYTWPEDKK